MQAESWHGTTGQRVFRISEVLENIICHLQLSGSLARMARVASASYEPSIKRLWSGKMFLGGDIYHLIGLFPPGLVASNGRVKSFSRPLIDEDWIRFEHYSAYVQSISLNDSIWHPETLRFPELFVSLGHRKPFPRLKSISAGWGFICQNSHWRNLAQAQLQTLIIKTPQNLTLKPSDVTIIEELMKTISSQSPNLKELYLPGFAKLGAFVLPDEFENVLRSSVLMMQGLNTFVMIWGIPIPEGVVKAVLSLPLLSSLYLSRLELPMEPLTKDIGLPNMESLRLWGSAGATCSSLNTLQQPDRLRFLNLTVRDHSSSLYTIQPIARSHNLRELRLGFPNVLDPLHWSGLKLVLECQQISVFDLNTRTVLEGFDDAALEELAASWKELSHLAIIEHAAGELLHRPSVALVALAVLADSCPHLNHVQLTVSTWMDEWSPSSEAMLTKMDDGGYRSPATRRLNTLNLGFTSIEPSWGYNTDRREEYLEPKAVAWIIRMIWPTLPPTSLSCSWSHTEQEATWGYVGDFLEAIDEKDQQRLKFLKERKLLKQQIADLTATNARLCQQLRGPQREGE